MIDPLEEIQYITTDIGGHNPLPPIPYCNNTGIPEPLEQICLIYDWIDENVDIWQDSVVVNGSLPFMRTEYF